MRARAELALAGMGLIWGAMFVVAKEALVDVTGTLYLALRFTLAAVVLGFVFRKRLKWDPVAAGLGFVLMAGYILQTLGLPFTTASKSAFLTGGYIVAVPFFAWLVYRNNPRIGEVGGVVTAGIGMALLSMQGESWAVGRGELLTIGCAVVFAVHIVLLGHFAPRMELGNLSFLQVAGAAAVAWVAMPFVETPAIRWRPAVVIAIVVGGLLATALAFVVQTWAQQHTTATRAALIFSLEPVFAWITSWWWQGEILTGRAAAGAGLILAGVLLVELKPSTQSTHHKEVN